MEIEIRAYVDSLARVESLLKKKGARFLDEQKIVDEWCCLKDCCRFEDVKQGSPGSYGLRIRTQQSIDGKLYSEINCKVLEREGDHNSFHEHETEIKDPEGMRKILESIGFKVFCTINKTRRMYQIGDCRINLENIQGFRQAVELEIIDHDHNREKHYRTMNNILKMLEIRQENYIKTSITAEYMEKNSFND
ncbi:MAG: class IV adenylate cyclase [Nanoarchaeota archaeon]|nr:class IV adenylate cyclase [Nanoarchaeota archaeon]